MKRALATGKRFALWVVQPYNGYLIRGIMSALLIGQGIIRIIDGRLFALPVLSLFPDGMFGHMQLLVGLALAFSYTRRADSGGALVAALAAGVWAMAVYATWGVAVTSSWAAFIFVLLAIKEACASIPQPVAHHVT